MTKVGLFVHSEKTALYGFVLLNMVLKLIPAWAIELGNDEVYYWTYALYPNWSHFDHPPLIGITIQLFTLNLKLHGELFFRLGSVILSSGSLFVLFYLTKKLYGATAGFIAIGLFAASGYFNIISGLMVHPDSPQVFFILLAYYFLFSAFKANESKQKSNISLLISAVFIGLALLSKYHSLYIWAGVGLFILFHNQNWLKRWNLYVGVFVTILFILPILYWNYQNNFISFTFHSNRVGFFSSPFNLVSFVQFLVGQIVYQNPINFFIYVAALVWLIKSWNKNGGKEELLLIYLSLPIILLFTGISMFKPSLPHWSGPGYIGLIIIASKWLTEKYGNNKQRVKYLLVSAYTLLLIVIYFAVVQVNFELFKISPKHTNPTQRGQGDFTLDMYGWEQAKEKIENRFEERGIDPKTAVFVSNKWFPASHIDYYIASPLGSQLLVLGKLSDIHKYYWINSKRNINFRNSFYYLTTSQQYKSPDYLNNYFNSIEPLDTIGIERNREIVKYLFLFELKNYRNNLTNFNLPASEE